MNSGERHRKEKDMEKKLEMTPEEIVRSYREAADKKEQVQILADLNLCSRETIRRVLIEGGVKPQELPRQRKKEPSAVAAEVKAYEKDRKAALVNEALSVLRDKLQKEYGEVYQEYERIKADFDNIQAEYLGKINAIDVMLGEVG